jgi:MinD superfamily P-loop ATPase
MEPTTVTLPPLGTSGEVITFYSYKGGTGRTMALSNIAVLLARQQNATTPVLMIDWDLEAPGLHHYFADQHVDASPECWNCSRPAANSSSAAARRRCARRGRAGP